MSVCTPNWRPWTLCRKFLNSYSNFWELIRYVGQLSATALLFLNKTTDDSKPCNAFLPSQETKTFFVSWLKSLSLKAQSFILLTAQLSSVTVSLTPWNQTLLCQL